MKRIAVFGTLALGLTLVLAACSDRQDPLVVSAHPDGWLTPTADEFHGLMVLESVNKSTSCTSCHGEDYLGGSSGVSCMASGCHGSYPHPAGFADRESSDFHATFVADMIAWDITTCQSCHGTDYEGKTYEVKNCTTSGCHTQEGGPEACTTCHGGLDDSGAPPEDLMGNSETSAKGVGAHQAHLGESAIASGSILVCQACHVVPDALQSDGHLDSSPGAEVVFGAFASRDGDVTPVWNAATATCNNVYCHGNFVFRKEDSATQFVYIEDQMVGNNPAMSWVDVGAGQAACGTCHGLPPQGHSPIPTCSGCHGRVVDANLQIINPELHINGQIEVF